MDYLACGMEVQLVVKSTPSRKPFVLWLPEPAVSQAAGCLACNARLQH